MSRDLVERKAFDNKIFDAIAQLLSGQRVDGISDMVNLGDNIVVGLSGGADSVALTDFLVTISNFFQLKIKACHVNHGIRGNEADADQEFVRLYCDKLKIDLLEKKVNLPELAKVEKKSFEELGREVRYQFFYECAKEHNAKIATAHNLNDNVETVILNLIRGSGLKGLCGIPAQRDKIIRPFINFSRQDIERYCEEKGLSFVIDSSNLSVDYSRNLIRHKIIPIVSKINPKFESTIKRNCDIILRDELYLSEVSQVALKDMSDLNGYSIEKLSLCNENIKARVVKQILKINDLPYSYKKINIFLNFVFESPSSKMVLSDKKYLCKNGNYFKICDIIKGGYQDNKNESQQKMLPIDLYCDLSRNYISYDIVKYSSLENEIKNNKSILKQCIDYDRIVGKPVLRTKKNGDKVRLAYRGVSKSLKKLFSEEKISVKDRNNLLVISDDVGVVWVQNFGADERVNVTPNTNNILFLSL